MKCYHITSLLKTIAQLSTAFGKSSVSWSARLWLLRTGLASQPYLTPLATHWTLQLYGPSSHTLTVCWETRSLWVSQDSASPGSRCTACLCSGLLPRQFLQWTASEDRHPAMSPLEYEQAGWPPIIKDSGALTLGSSSCKKTHSMCRCHLTLFLLPVGMGAQRTNRKADTLATAIAGRNKLSLVSCSLVFCRHPQNHGKLTC